MVRMVQPNALAMGLVPAGLPAQLPNLELLNQAGGLNPTMVSPTATPTAATAAPPASWAPLGTERAEGSFADTLSRLVQEVNHKQQVSRQSLHGLLNGQSVPLHQAMIAMEEASVSFQLMVEVRNKLLESYQELMRMQI